MKRDVMASVLILFLVYRPGPAPEATGSFHLASGLQLSFSGNSQPPAQGFEAPPALEDSLFPEAGQGDFVIRGLALVGTGAGLALAVWGLGSGAEALATGAPAAELYKSLGFVVWGSLVTGLSSTIASFYKP